MYCGGGGPYPPLARTVVRLALTAATELHLVPLEVRLVLNNLNERHLRKRARVAAGRAAIGKGRIP